MKKMTKKLGAIVLALAMCFSLCCTALAAAEDYTITIINATTGETYTAYKIFDATVGSNDNVSYTIDSTKDETMYSYVIADSYTVTNDEGEVIGTYVNPFKFTSALNDGVYTVEVATKGDGSEYTDTEIINFLNAMIAQMSSDDALPEAADSETASSEEVVLNVGDTGAGYYFVTSSLGAVVSITTTDPHATIIDKNNPPSVEKEISEGLDRSGDLESDTEAIGDDVKFKVTGNVPLYTTGDDDVSGGYLVTDYEFTDHMSAGLEIRELEEDTDYTVKVDDTTGETHYYATESLVEKWVKLNGESIYSQAYNVVLELTSPNTYTDENGQEALEFGGFYLTYDTIDCKDELDGTQYGKASDIQTNYPVNSTIEIDYTAHVTGEEVEYDNTNDIDMVWHITTFTNPGQPEYGGHSHDDNDVYVLALTILKVDGADGISPLSGATFKLEGTNLNEVVTNTSETYTELSKDEYEAAKAEGTELWFALVSGGYTNVDPYDLLKEDPDADLSNYVKDEQPNAPEDYLYVANTRTIIYTNTTQPAEDKAVTGTTDENGVLSFDGLTEGTWTLTEIVAPNGYNLLTDSYTIEISVTGWQTDSSTGKTVPIWSVEGADFDGETGVLSLEVINNSGTELPGTGGIGTTIFYIIGGVLVVGAVVVLVTRRRVNREA